MTLVATRESAAARSATVAAALGLAGCGSGSGAGIDTGPLVPTIESIQANVFDAFCISCHDGATAPLGLRLDAANSYALLVGVPSVEVPSVQRVRSGNPNASYLIQKLEGTAPVGGRMPLGGTPLPQADIDVVRQWIADGAQPEASSVGADPIRVTTLSPLPAASEPLVPLSIMAAFDRELNAASVDATTIVVERSGRDGVFGNGNDIVVPPVAVRVPAANPRSAIVDLGNTAPVEDTYRVTLVGTGAATIQDLAGNALDGEFDGVFPSGDGAQGGNFVATFQLAAIQPTLQSIQDNVFTPICATCHTGPGSSTLPSGLDLTSLSMSYMSLVGVASIEQPQLRRVAPTDPASSYLIRKLEGVAAVGGRMPLSGPPLEPTTIDTIRQWIAHGAAL